MKKYEEAAILRDKLNSIEFSIGPKDKEQHDKVIEWLKENKYEIKNISFNGDHYSEILIFGVFENFLNHWKDKPGLSYEHWEE
jgi:hypothetical protein